MLAFHGLLYHTRFGTYVFALGGNREALRLPAFRRQALIASMRSAASWPALPALLMTAPHEFGAPDRGHRHGIRRHRRGRGRRHLVRARQWLAARHASWRHRRRRAAQRAQPDLAALLGAGRKRRRPRHRRAVPRRLAEPAHDQHRTKRPAAATFVPVAGRDPAVLPAARGIPDLRRAGGAERCRFLSPATSSTCCARRA